MSHLSILCLLGLLIEVHIERKKSPFFYYKVITSNLFVICGVSDSSLRRSSLQLIWLSHENLQTSYLKDIRKPQSTSCSLSWGCFPTAEILCTQLYFLKSWKPPLQLLHQRVLTLGSVTSNPEAKNIGGNALWLGLFFPLTGTCSLQQELAIRIEI